MSRGPGLKTYQTWTDMRRRCGNAKNITYASYGGRGITVCDRWQLFENFLADMGERPHGMEIDRIDNDGNYEPGNCRWATCRENSLNRRSTKFVEFRGERLCVTEWACRIGIDPASLSARLKKWPLERAMTEPRSGRGGGGRRIYPDRKACVVCGSKFTVNPLKRGRNKTCSPVCAQSSRVRKAG